MNQITDFKFAESLWVGEAKEVGRVFSEKEPRQGLQKVMKTCETGAEGTLAGPRGELSLCFSFAKILLGHEPSLFPLQRVSVWEGDSHP